MDDSVFGHRDCSKMGLGGDPFFHLTKCIDNDKMGVHKVPPRQMEAVVARSVLSCHSRTHQAFCHCRFQFFMRSHF